MDDILPIIAQYLDLHNVHTCMMTCSQFYRIMNTNKVWSILCTKYDYTLPGHNYKQQFKSCVNLKKFINKIGNEWTEEYGRRVVTPFRHHPSVKQIINLQELKLNWEPMSPFIHDICNLVNLQTLHLHFCKLNSLPVEIGNLTNLRILDLSNNRINPLPGDLGKLINLQRLNLSCNGLESLPGEIGNLINLQKLNVHRNRLNTLPKEMGRLTNLQKLSAFSNLLSWLP